MILICHFSVGPADAAGRGGLLSEALTGESGGYEVLATAEQGTSGAGSTVVDHASLLSADAERGFHSGTR